ncbi:MAG TPA: hypothetical protein VF170_00630, partial [Planctomycetaceae bacterium]
RAAGRRGRGPRAFGRPAEPTTAETPKQDATAGPFGPAVVRFHITCESSTPAGDRRRKEAAMDKWMRRRLDYLRSQLQRQELQLDVAKGQKDPEAISRLERQIEATKSDMVRVIGG